MRNATFDLTQFGGLSPRTEPRLLRESMATIALDVNLLHGDLRPRRVPLAEGTVFPAGTDTIYNHCGEWLGFVGKVYLAESLGDDQRLYIAGAGVPRVRSCDGTVNLLGVPGAENTLVTTLVDAALDDYGFTFYGWYEGPDGQRYDRQLISPTAVSVGSEYTFAPFAATTAPADAVFCVSMTATKSGDLLGVVYSDNSFLAGNSDLAIQGQSTTLRLYDRSSGTDEPYDGDPLPSLFGLRLDYQATDSAATSRSYVYTYVRQWPDGTEDESAPSPATDIITVDATGAVVLSGFVDPNRADINVIRIYRTDVNGNFRFVGDIPVTQSSYTDTLLDTELGETLPSSGWNVPPDDLSGLVAMPNGFMIGYSGNTLYPSALNQEHAFPPEFTKVIKGANIVGIAGAFENSLVVATDCHPYIVTAYSPDNLTVTKVNALQPCVSALSLVDMGRYGVGYISMHGVVLVRAGDAPVMSEPFYTSEQWQDLDPRSMRCSWHHEALHVVSDVEHLVWDMSEGEDILTRSSFLPGAMFTQCESQKLWVSLGDVLHEWEAGETGRFLWRGRESSLSRPVDFVRAIVESEGKVTLRLLADDVLVYERTFVSEEPFALPVLPRSKHWYVEIESGVEVDRFTVTNDHGRL